MQSGLVRSFCSVRGKRRVVASDRLTVDRVTGKVVVYQTKRLVYVMVCGARVTLPMVIQR